MDLKIIETGGGGDLVLQGNDLARVLGEENGPYLAMFSSGDHWASYMDPELAYGGKTEAALKSNPLTSAGRIAVLAAVNEDLAYLNATPGTKWTANVSINGVNRWLIEVVINGELFSYSFNPDQ
jgi:hypothetical protein